MSEEAREGRDDEQINQQLAEIAKPHAVALYGKGFFVGHNGLKLALTDGKRGRWAEWSPITNWDQLMPLLESYNVTLLKFDDNHRCSLYRKGWREHCGTGFGKTRQHAIARALTRTGDSDAAAE